MECIVKKFVIWLVTSLMKLSLKVRYRVTVKGLDQLNSKTLNKSGGILFMPNHSSFFVDPTLVSLAILKKYKLRPLIVEYMYYTPFVHWIAKNMDALPIPKFDFGSNSLKRRKSEKIIQEVISALRTGSNFLIYPAGRVKHTNMEIIGGSSGVHSILQQAPGTNVVLVRITGLYGSSFSLALTSSSNSMFTTIFNGVKIALKNLIFFTPKRHITIEFTPAPADFPYHLSRIEMNKYLENFYNRPDGLSNQIGEFPGESLTLVSYSFWKKEYPTVKTIEKQTDETTDPNLIPDDVRYKVTTRIASMVAIDPSKIKDDMGLSTDLGMDSLDISDIGTFLADQFECGVIPQQELTTVGRVLAIASKQLVFDGQDEEKEVSIANWRKPIPKFRVNMPSGKTMAEVFINNCDRLGNNISCGDDRTGVVTYSQMKLRAILLAEYIRKIPGEYVGILLPASVAANLCIFACQLAGKVPLLINWTVGTRHLESVLKVCDPKAILSSWTFLDRLLNADLSPIEDRLIMLEDVRRDFGLGDKIKAKIRSKRSAASLLKIFNIQDKTEEDCAVVLFTSGTESMPKGVPLTHGNILSNQRDVMEVIELYSDDVFYAILPPFHSFGFTITGTLPLLCGLKVAYFPDPTDGKRIAKGIEKWGITVICGAPTFLKGIFKSSNSDQIKTLRYCVSGAEKAPPELYQLLTNLGKEGILQEGYGITECSPVLTTNRFNEPPIGVGKALPNVELCIVNQETHEPVPNGERGLIFARGPNIFSGYLNPGLASPFVEMGGKSWYQTGDLGYLDDKNQLAISGRLKRFIKIGAEMVSLAGIEDALLHEALRKQWTVHEDGPVLAVCAKEDEGQRPKISLFCKFPADVDDVNRSLKEAGFSNIVKVTSVHQLKEIPIMGTGKINYRELETNYVN